MRRNGKKFLKGKSKRARRIEQKARKYDLVKITHGYQLPPSLLRDILYPLSDMTHVSLLSPTLDNPRWQLYPSCAIHAKEPKIAKAG